MPLLKFLSWNNNDLTVIVIEDSTEHFAKKSYWRNLSYWGWVNEIAGSENFLASSLQACCKNIF